MLDEWWFVYFEISSSKFFHRLGATSLTLGNELFVNGGSTPVSPRDRRCAHQYATQEGEALSYSLCNLISAWALLIILAKRAGICAVTKPALTTPG